MIHLVEIGCYVGGLSTSTHAVGGGVRSFLMASGPRATADMTLRVEAAGDPSKWMEGLVVEASSAGFTLSVKSWSGTGAVSSWRLAAGQLRFSTAEYGGAGAPGPYEPVIAPEGYARGKVSLHGDGRSFGAGDVEKGLIKVINKGERDHLRRYAYFGRVARELVVDGPATPYAEAVVLRTGTVEQPVVGDEDVLFRWRGRLADLDSRWQGSTFPGGTGAGMSTDGAEGLKDLPRPRLRGYRAQIEPVPTNVSGTLRQISDRRIHGVADGRCRGVPNPVGTRYASLAALKAATPAAGTFNWYAGEAGDGAWCVTTVGSQAGVFTLAAWEGETAADRTLAQVWRRVLIEDCGYAATEIADADVAALDDTCPWEAGVWAGTQEKTKRDALNELVDGVAGYYDDDLGRWRIRYDGAAGGDPVIVFRHFLENDDYAMGGEVPYVALELVASADDTKGLPVCAVDVQFAPRDRVLSDGDMAGDATSTTDSVGGADARKQLGSEALTATWPASGKDETVIALWGERRLPVKTSLRYREHALTHAQRLHAVHSVLRDRYVATGFLTTETAVARPGAVVGLQSRRYGLDAGQTLRVNGRTLEGKTLKLDLLETPE
ncbi:hypothetical protein [Azospirillum picis]|uniref:Tip attachment protein J domain-containing protein n=1 Tax=Azospirillum picis TaxID=488438 RepID=A0ABU0MRZ5_9PROT|nr:hypothetical protein [Azospirillum picis]MBP2302516.1 hypothetical protein [Azospirillum picis]MDQ0536242.1 hypothetical protein [Azospirillum picis]